MKIIFRKKQNKTKRVHTYACSSYSKCEKFKNKAFLNCLFKDGVLSLDKSPSTIIIAVRKNFSQPFCKVWT